MIVAASCGTKNNNASLQSNNYGQLNHTDGKSYCSVSYLEERLIADSSCIGSLGNNIWIKHSDTDTQWFGLESRPLQNKRVACSGVVLILCSCLLGARARTLASKNKESRPNHNTDSEMIVAASCGTKNNNASLQSNN